MSVSLRYTSSDLELIPAVEGKRYEIIDGDLYVTHAPSLGHQYVCLRMGRALDEWNDVADLGTPYGSPGLVFPGDDDVMPDLIWVSHDRENAGTDAADHLTVAPELAIEVLSSGSTNERRDRQLKLKLYSRQGVLEYWIVDWQRREIKVYRRADQALTLVATLLDDDRLESPLLPGFSVPISWFWPRRSRG
jgi:Uma2 family endonuclease